MRKGRSEGATLPALVLAAVVSMLPGSVLGASDAARLEALDADLVAVHTAVSEGLEAASLAINDLNADTYGLRLDEVGEDAARAKEAILEVGEAAREGLDVLDEHGWIACAADYLSVERAAFLLLLDGVEQTLAGNVLEAPRQLSAGIYMVMSYADLIRSTVEC